MKIEVSFRVAGLVISGVLTGDKKERLFYSSNEYFVAQFPGHCASFQSYLRFVEIDCDVRSEQQEEIYNKLFSLARLFIDHTDDAFEANTYKALYQISDAMTDADANSSVSYVCAPISKLALRAFREKYHETDTINKYRPSYPNEYTIYQVKSSPVYNADETEYEFVRLWDKAIAFHRD